MSFPFPFFQDIWEAISMFLLHPHMWLRNTSSRLVASYFVYVSEAKKSNQTGLNLESFLLMKPSRLFRIAVSLCCQLQSQVTDGSVANLITENLVVTICSVHSFAKQRKCIGLFEFLSKLALSERDHFGKSFELLGSRKVQNLFHVLTSGDSGGDVTLMDQNIHSIVDLQALLVVPLLKRMGKLALQKEDNQVRSSWFEKKLLYIRSFMKLYNNCLFILNNIDHSFRIFHVLYIFFFKVVKRM